MSLLYCVFSFPPHRCGGGVGVAYIFILYYFPFSPAQVWWGVGDALYLVDLMFIHLLLFITQTFMAADRLPRKHREIQEGKFCSNTYPSGIQAYNKQRLKV